MGSGLAPGIATHWGEIAGSCVVARMLPTRCACACWALVAVTERVTVRLPDGFDPDRHAAALARLIADRHGAGFEVVSIDPAGRTAYATRQVAITEVSADRAAADSFQVRLARGTKPDGERLAAKLAEQNPGFEMTAFEPFLGRATLSRLDRRRHGAGPPSRWPSASSRGRCGSGPVPAAGSKWTCPPATRRPGTTGNSPRSRRRWWAAPAGSSTPTRAR